MTVNRNHRNHGYHQSIHILVLQLGWLLALTSAFVPVPPKFSPPRHARHMVLSVQSIRLEGIDPDGSELGSELAGSVQRWLDAEWLPQEIHASMGRVCQDVYQQARASGDDEVASIMMKISDTLMEQWDDFNKDAFINPFDCANYCSDFLTSYTLTEDERCACSFRIH